MVQWSLTIVDEQVTEKKARQWTEDEGNLAYFETSAKDGTNVEEAFQVLAEQTVRDLLSGSGSMG